jgi:hypothetical protein
LQASLERLFPGIGQLLDTRGLLSGSGQQAHGAGLRVHGNLTLDT